MSSSSLQCLLHVQLTFLPRFAIMTIYFQRTIVATSLIRSTRPINHKLYIPYSISIFHKIFHTIQALTLKRTLFLFTNSHDCHDVISEGKFHNHVTCYGVIIQPSFINIGEPFNIISAKESQPNCETIAWLRRPASAHKRVRTDGVTHAAQCIRNIALRMVQSVLFQKCQNGDQETWLCSPIQANVITPNLTMKASIHILS
jgi:hypothetical protein